MNHFHSQECLDKHKEYCMNHDFVKSELPKKDTKLSFKNHMRAMKVPFIIYADFESFIPKIDTVQQNPEKSYTESYQKHTPSGFCYYIKAFDEELQKMLNYPPVIYSKKTEEEDIGQIFTDYLQEDVKKLYEMFSFPRKIIITKEVETIYKNSIKCWICQKLFVENDASEAGGDDKVKDHCHFTGKFRGAAHRSCNFRFKKPTFIPVVFHNLSGYDAHLFIKNLGTDKGNIKCIPNTDEKYISFSKEIIIGTYKDKKTGEEKNIKKELRFIDSYKFLLSGLDKLVYNLDKDMCKNIRVITKKKEKLDLLFRKVFILTSIWIHWKK